MLNKIKDFIFEQKARVETIDSEMPILVPMAQEKSEDTRLHKILNAALEHYCELCDRGFKTRGARNAHKSLKHKNNEQ